MATKTKKPVEEILAVVYRVMAGEITCEQGSYELGFTHSALSGWMRRNGYQTPSKYKRERIEPTERDINALRQYWRRDCNQQELMAYTGRSYLVVKRWIDAGIGKE